MVMENFNDLISLTRRLHAHIKYAEGADFPLSITDLGAGHVFPLAPALVLRQVLPPGVLLSLSFGCDLFRLSIFWFHLKALATHAC